MLRCETCLHWQPIDRLASYAAPCALECYPGRVPFNLTCDQHSSAPPPAPDMQSQARGVPMLPWAGVWGTKP